MTCLREELRHSYRLVGDPIDPLTGANTEVARDFMLPGPIPLLWRRHYDSSRAGTRYGLGWGHSHEYERTLRFDTDGMRYVGPLELSVTFSPLTRDGDFVSSSGLTLRRISALLYRVAEPDRPTMEFEFKELVRPAPLSALVQGGDRVGFRYTKDGRLEAIVGPTGRLIRVDSDPRGAVIRLMLSSTTQRPDRMLIAYEYDAAGNLLRGIDAYHHSFSFGYDSDNRIARRTDRRGYSFYFSYDHLGRCVHSRGEDGLYEVHLDYHPEERRTQVTEADGGVWEYRYDENVLLTEIVDPYGGVRGFQNDASGAVEKEVDPNGDITIWVYSQSGKLLGKRSSLGHFSSDASGPLRPDQRAHRTPSRPSEWEYGALLTPARLRDLSAGPASTAELPESLRRLTARLLGREPASRDFGPAPGSTPEPRAREDFGTVYDELGVRLREVGPNDSARHWTYDAGGNTVRYQDFDGSVVLCDYSSWDLPTRRTDPMGRTVAKQFTKSAKLAEVVDPGGTRSAYVYDLKGRLAEVWYDGVRVEQYRYDAADNITAKLDGNGQPIVTLEIGPKNLKTVRHLASGETHRFAYTERGYYAGLGTDDVSVKFDYDSSGNRTLDERDGLGVEHRFDGLGALRRTTVLKRFVTHYRRQTDTTLEIRDPGGRRHVIHLLSGGVVARSMSSGLLEVAQYDGLGRCRAKVAGRTQTLEGPWERHFAYSGEGDLLEVRDSGAGVTRYEYDAAHRLRRASNGNGTAENYRHDAGDNLVEQPGLVGVSIVSGNRLGSANGDQFEYDDHGNIAVRRGRGGVTRFRYDSRNMLVSCETGREEWRATYDPLGRRVRKTFGEEWREFYWDSDRLAAEVHHDGRLRVYVYADAFAMVPLLWLDYDGLDADLSTGKRYFMLCNHLGTPTRIEDDAGDVVWRARVAPYGATVTPEDPRVEAPLRFPGHYYDAETGLHYNRFRYYSPELGRYLQVDRLGASAGNNLYASTTNPLKEVDLRGDCPDDGTAKNKRKTTEEGDPAEGPTLQEEAGFPPRTRKAVAVANQLADSLNAHMDTLPPNDPLRKSANAVGVMTHPDGTVTVAVSGSPAAVDRANQAMQPTLDQMQQNGQISGYRFGPDNALQQSSDQRTTCAAPRLGDGARTPDSPPPSGVGPRQPDPNGTQPPPPNGMAEAWRRDDKPNPNPDPRGQNTMHPCDSCASHSHGIMNGPIED